MNKSIWYHGSPVKGIKSFVVDRPRYDSIEGQGVYLSQSYAIARGYAGPEGSVYEVELQGAILNMTSEDEIENMVSIASKIVGFNVRTLELAEETFKEIIQGRYQIGPHKGMGVGWQIKNLLLNHEPFIILEGADDKSLEVEVKINEYLMSHDAWLYEDTKLGLVIVVKNPEKVRPIKEIEVGTSSDEENL